jgi:hypothetical protein
MTTTTWIIEYMQTSTQVINGHSEVVLTAGWKCNGSNTVGNINYTTSKQGVASFPEPSVGGTFTPYADLTQDQVLGWCWENGVNKTGIETEIQLFIEQQITPLVVTPALPWAGA